MRRSWCLVNLKCVGVECDSKEKEEKKDIISLSMKKAKMVVWKRKFVKGKVVWIIRKDEGRKKKVIILLK